MRNSGRLWVFLQVARLHWGWRNHLFAWIYWGWFVFSLSVNPKSKLKPSLLLAPHNKRLETISLRQAERLVKVMFFPNHTQNWRNLCFPNWFQRVWHLRLYICFWSRGQKRSFKCFTAGAATWPLCALWRRAQVGIQQRPGGSQQGIS